MQSSQIILIFVGLLVCAQSISGAIAESHYDDKENLVQKLVDNARWRVLLNTVYHNNLDHDEPENAFSPEEERSSEQDSEEPSEQKRDRTYLRFGKRAEHSTNLKYMRFGKRQSVNLKYMRFGKRNPTYLRFGRNIDQAIKE